MIKAILKSMGGQVFLTSLSDDEYRQIQNSIHWQRWVREKEYKLNDGLMMPGLAELYKKGSEIIIKIEPGTGRIMDHELATWSK
jgi:hypothetical protein